MKHLLWILLLLPSLAQAATAYVAVGYVNYFRSHDDIDMNSETIFLGLETEETYPWVFSASYVPSYARTTFGYKGEEYARDAKSHYVFTVGKQINYTFDNDIKVYAEFGLATVDRKNLAIDSYYNAYEALGVEYANVKVFLRHVSNAGIDGHNLGEDVLYVGYNLPF